MPNFLKTNKEQVGGHRLLHDHGLELVPRTCLKVVVEFPILTVCT